MLNIALCDDDAKLLNNVKIFILGYFKNISRSARIKEFAHSNRLVESISDGDRFDIYILDVEMPEANGFEVARKIRITQPNAVIIFLSSHLECADEGYKVHALRYVHKLKLPVAIPEALDAAIMELERIDEGSLLVSYYGNLTRILHRDIIYIKKTLRSLEIVTTEQGTISDNRGLRELYGVINDSRFIFTERSCLVNLDFARQIEGSFLVLKSGEKVPISRPMMPSVKAAIICLFGG